MLTPGLVNLVGSKGANTGVLVGGKVVAVAVGTGVFVGKGLGVGEGTCVMNPIVGATVGTSSSCVQPKNATDIKVNEINLCMTSMQLNFEVETSTMVVLPQHYWLN